MVTPRSAGERTVVILYHKPPNLVTSHSNNDAAPAASGEQSRRTVYDDVSTLNGFVGDRKGSFAEVTGVSSKLHAIGRLDADTSGLLLMTNDGGLVHHVTNPVAKGDADECITKTYEAVIMGRYENNSTELQKIREKGVDIGAKYGGMTQPAKDLQVLGHPTAKSTLVSITIAEGKNRQVRRMFHGINSGVMRLKRTHIGATLNLGDLGEGEWRLLTDNEIVDCLGWKPRNIEVESSRPSQLQSRHTTARRRKRQ
jgi:pseudouridine synthase